MHSRFPSCDFVSFVVLLCVDFPFSLCENPPKRPLCGGKSRQHIRTQTAFRWRIPDLNPMIVYPISARVVPLSHIPGRNA